MPEKPAMEIRVTHRVRQITGWAVASFSPSSRPARASRWACRVSRTNRVMPIPAVRARQAANSSGGRKPMVPRLSSPSSPPIDGRGASSGVEALRGAGITDCP